MIPPRDAAYRLTLEGGRVRWPQDAEAYQSLPLAEAVQALPPVPEAARAAGQARTLRMLGMALGATLVGSLAAWWGWAATPLVGTLGDPPGRLGLGLAAAAVVLFLQPRWMPLPRLGAARTRGAPLEVLEAGSGRLVVRVHDAALAAALGRENGVAPVPEVGRGRGPGPRDAWVTGPLARTLAIGAALALAASLGG